MTLRTKLVAMTAGTIVALIILFAVGSLKPMPPAEKIKEYFD